MLLNKGGFSPEVKGKIVASVEEFGGRIVGSIPFDQKIPQALQELKSLADMDEYRDTIGELLEQIVES